MNRVRGGKSALLVVDMQRALFERSTPVFRADDLLTTVNDLAAHARQAGAPVVFVQHSNKMMPVGSDGWSLHQRIHVDPADLTIGKTHGDAFDGTDLEAVLRDRSVSTVYVTGLVTHGCVRATCLGAHRRGFDVVLVADGHSGYNREAAELISHWNGVLAGQIEAVAPAAQIQFDEAG